jgi:hypothetical protein
LVYWYPNEEYSTNKTDPHWNLVKLVLDTKPSSPYVSNLYVYIFLMFFFYCIERAQSSVFCVVFCKPLLIILSFFVWPLHCLPFFDLWLTITLLASTKFSYLLTYTRTAMLSQLSNWFHCNIYVKIRVWFRFEDCLNIDRPRYIHS